MGTDRHNCQVALEIRHPIEPVCREFKFGKFTNDFVSLVLYKPLAPGRFAWQTM